MTLKLNQQKYITSWVIFIFLISIHGAAQEEEEFLRFEFGFGLNTAKDSGFPESFASSGINAPAINVGAQYMFTEDLGAKFDLGFNRIKGQGNSETFKINYTRLNLQGVYECADFMGLGIKKLKTQLHAGPGYAFVKPLSSPYNNNQYYINAIFGVEFLYALNKTSSLFFDISHIHGFTEPEIYSPSTSGQGAFNGSILTFTLGISLSLSEGCNSCYQ